jgi:hypothetical protein
VNLETAAVLEAASHVIVGIVAAATGAEACAGTGQVRAGVVGVTGVTGVVGVVVAAVVAAANIAAFPVLVAQS